VASVQNSISVTVKNCEVEFIGDANKNSALLGVFTNGSRFTTNNIVNIENVKITGVGKTNSMMLTMSSKSFYTDLYYNGIIVEMSGQKFYMGSDFSNFVVSWKTGRIEPKGHVSTGIFQGKVDKNILEYKGYIEKVVPFG